MRQRIVLGYDQDPGRVPTPPDEGASAEVVAAFMAEMDRFVEEWQPAPPPGYGWEMEGKSWFCTDPCNGCEVPVDDHGACLFNGVHLKSTWTKESI